MTVGELVAQLRLCRPSADAVVEIDHQLYHVLFVDWRDCKVVIRAETAEPR